VRWNKIIGDEQMVLICVLGEIKDTFDNKNGWLGVTVWPRI